MATPDDRVAAGSAADEDPFDGRFEGRLAFQQILRGAFDAAGRERWADMLWCDPDFSDWPLGERAVIAALNAWAHPRRRLLILAGDFRPLQRQHARFVEWRRTWDLILDCRQAAPVDARTLPSLLIGPSWALRRHDVERCRGATAADALTRVRWRETLGDALSRSRLSFPASTLGL